MQDTDSIPGQESGIPHVIQTKPKKQKQNWSIKNIF